MRNGEPIAGATNQRYIWFVGVSGKSKCQNWRYLDFIAQMHKLFCGSDPIHDQDEFDSFILNNKHKYKAHIYETT